MCIWWHSAVSYTFISVSELCNFFSFFPYFHELIHYMLYQNLLPTERSFQPCIICHALFQFIFWFKRNIQRPSVLCEDYVSEYVILWQCSSMYLSDESCRCSSKLPQIWWKWLPYCSSIHQETRTVQVRVCNIFMQQL